MDGGDMENERALGFAWDMSDDLVGPSTIAFRGSPVDCGLYKLKVTAVPEMFVKLFENLFESQDVGLSVFWILT
jgi:hypothetical protein